MKQCSTRASASAGPEICGDACAILLNTFSSVVCAPAPAEAVVEAAGANPPMDAEAGLDADDDADANPATATEDGAVLEEDDAAANPPMGDDDEDPLDFDFCSSARADCADRYSASWVCWSVALVCAAERSSRIVPKSLRAFVMCERTMPSGNSETTARILSVCFRACTISPWSSAARFMALNILPSGGYQESSKCQAEMGKTQQKRFHAFFFN
jgi:hypothetical protein